MKLLFDNNKGSIHQRMKTYPFIGGQLITPLTGNSNAGLRFGVDNGCFSRFKKREWLRLFERDKKYVENCVFVTMPDVVGNARRTLELFSHWSHAFSVIHDQWPVALVAQDGIEDLEIEWHRLKAIFIGGSDNFKDSKIAADVIKCAKLHGKHVHIGRVNSPSRWKHFEEMECDTFDLPLEFHEEFTCDGSGLSRYDWMLDRILNYESDELPLIDIFEAQEK